MQRMPYDNINRLSPIQRMCLSALYIAVGVVLPSIFHSIAGPKAGMLFLPMHIPVLMSGLTLGPYYGAAVGALLPVISSIITGMSMPPLVRLPFMVLELLCLGLVTGILKAKKKGIYLSLIVAQILGRIVYSVSVLISTYVFSIALPPAMAVKTTLVTGIPGLILQVILIPPLVFIINKSIDVKDNC